MLLADLDPRWYTFAHTAKGVDIRLGLTFLCPCCKEQRLGVAFDPPIYPHGWLNASNWKPTGKEWRRTGDTFDTLTLTPSIDASAVLSGHWHGSITNGAIS